MKKESRKNNNLQADQGSDIEFQTEYFHTSEVCACIAHVCMYMC